ncbi:2-oxoacid:acceptor oxidoreductase subunit alpha [Undibacter mobilis]|uniref:2-oxoacid:acceptor oxidoreductase subunit alpha n=1 Tax=Undibacter mobilis TaxID=2292256 RepID=A0A371B9R7_9BRAD|nr:2-oxoacid:acceptor oxidoreductase subunit alpha [Undibacter mobilis]RDV04359.1 2-oxoacid:acceptor oxidoreductase subunit alpha [Undibacter mobilis]
MTRQSIAVVFAGSGGSGAMSAGAVFLRAAARAGYYGMMTQLFGAQVRGGESASLVQIGVAPVDAPPDRYDVFVALDWDKVEQFAAEIPLDETTLIMADPAAGAVPPGIARSKGKVVALPMTDSSETKSDRALHGKRVNMFATGCLAALCGIAPDNVAGAIEAIFGDKGKDVTAANAARAAAGAQAAKGLGLDLALAAPTKAARWLINGNQAAALGALRGGVRFVGCYPITPATDLVEWLAPHLIKLGGRLVLGEDELASINLVLGASFGGVPAMTVTSGPGLSLMVESLGLAIAAEIPMVLIDVMRAGPSTGIASKTEQSDLNIAIYGTHGDAPHIVMAPLSVADCAATTEYAVYVSESLQVPAIVLSDQMLGQATAVIDPVSDRPAPMVRKTNGVAPGQPFKRYATGGDAVTPMPSPGTPGREWVAEGLTHNEAGLPASGAAMHVAQIHKRARKIREFDPGAHWGEVTGAGDTAILAFGSTVGAAREAARRLAETGHPVRVIALRMLSPLPMHALAQALDGVKRLIVIEQNDSGQLYRHLLGHKAVPVETESVARPGPLPFRPSEIVNYVA